jgi:probable F420-dependent oxidoreductase
MTVPFDGVPLSEQADWFKELEDLGYTDVWSAESNGADGLQPLALASTWAPSLRLGTAILSAYTRGPGLMAMSAATLAEAAPGRVVIGIGASSDVIVERWNDIPFVKPYQQTRDMVEFLRAAMTGEKVTEDYETFSVKGFKLGRIPAEPPQLMVAALREGMLKLAGRISDGAIINWLSAEDVGRVAPIVQEAGGGGKEIVARIFVCPSTDTETVRRMARFNIATYLNVPVYAAFHDWMGRGDLLRGMWDAWKAGDRKAALEAIPDVVVDDLFIHGSPEACREHLDRYFENGVTTAALALQPFGIDPRQAMRDMAPAKG